MRKNLVVGIVQETKEKEFRVPLVPADVSWLVEKGVSVEVERSSKRVFTDKQYKDKGAKIVDRFKNATLFLGVKEPHIEKLHANKVYMLFSHTTKGQFNNVPLLKACLKKRITLIDYEKIVDMHGRRLVYFGRFAGVCGIIDSLHYLGQKLEWKGITNPFSLIKPAHQYNSLKAAKKAIVVVCRTIQRQGFSRKLSPFIIGITGHGNVSEGVQEILQLLNPIEVHPKDLHNLISKVVDYLHCDATRFRFIERPRGVAVEGGPGFLVDLGLERGLEGLVGVAGAQEISVPNKEAFFVVVGVDEPAGDTLRPVAAHLPSVGVEYVHSVDFYPNLPVASVQYVDVWLTEDNEQVALAGVLQVVSHM